MNEYVYYICYGSNLLTERFLLYIKGGINKELNISQEGCYDKSLPKEIITYDIPFNIYFAKESSKWEHKGVAFLDITKPGLSHAKGYLVTKDQFHCVKRQEGSWYDQEVYLGEKNGYPLYTFTSSVKYSQMNPGEKYLDVIRRGLLETYQDRTIEEINHYLQRSII